MNNQSKSNDVFQIMANQLIDLMKSSNLPIWKPGYYDLYQNNASTGTRYQGINIFLLTLTAYVKNFKSNKWLTFNQINQLGGRIIKGAKGTNIVYYFVANQVEIKRNQLEQLSDSNLPTVGKILKPKLHTVFNLDQTENLEINTEENFKIELDYDIDTLISNHSNLPSITNLINRNPAYSPVYDKVFMPLIGQYPSLDNYYADLFHELAHSTGHQSRLSRPAIVEIEHENINQYSEEELVAEFTACFCCEHFSLKPELNMSAAYLKGWLSYLENNETILVKAIQKAQKAAGYILQLE